MRWVLAWMMVVSAALASGPARAGDVMALIRADQWSEARAAARAQAGPLGVKLVTFYRLLAPLPPQARTDGQAWAARIAGFMAANPDWPFQGLLAQRRAEALGRATLPAARRPALLRRAARLRTLGQEDAAVALWVRQGAAAERARPDLGAMFWAEQQRLARRLLREGKPRRAEAVAAAQALRDGEAAADARFLAGWIALRFLHDPARAVPWFQALAAGSPAAITQGRAWYWLGRAAAAAGRARLARANYARAALWPETFYGQLAALKLGPPAALAARLRAARDPVATAPSGRAFADRELAQAAAVLVAWGGQRRARPFLGRLAWELPSAADQSLAARFATALGLPDAAVAVSRLAGARGVRLIDAGWPIPIAPPGGTGVPAPLVLGLVRQESSFDPRIVSWAGARGLMQLMPATASRIGQRIGLVVSTAALTEEPAVNLRLGTAYLRRMLDHYAGNIPEAVAAYNAGPRKVDAWLGEIGAPPIAGGDGTIDWIESIPYGETRDYVQRVIENMVVYAAKLGRETPRWGAP